MRPRIKIVQLVVVVGLAVGAWRPVVAGAEETSDGWAPVLAHGASVVGVEFVLPVKIEGAPADQEVEGDIDCLLVGDDGLILCSNLELGGFLSVLGRMMGRGRGIPMTGAPTEIEVRFGEQEPIPGELVTRDTDRDLAWIMVESVPEAAGVRSLDLDSHVDLVLGERFVALRRMHSFFDRAPAIVEGTIGAVTRRPRRLFVPSQPLGVGFGVPVFRTDGHLVGITVAQMPDAEDGEGSVRSPLPFLSSAAKTNDMIGGVVLPAAEVAKATRLAREQIAADAAELAGTSE